MKYLAVLLVALTSCAMNNELTSIKYKPTQESPKYKMDVPVGYEFKGYEVTVEKEKQYVYGDSSFIYITSFHNTPNYENIKELGDSVLNLRFQNSELTSQVNQLVGQKVITSLPDTFELSGLNSRNLYWKDIKIGSISIGYNNVAAYKKGLFDKALSSFRSTE